MRLTLRSLVLVIVASAFLPLPAQEPLPDRLDLGRLIRRLEGTWLATPDPEARRRAVDTVASAIAAWFRLDLHGVARDFVLAEAMLRSPEGASPLDLWAGSTIVAPVERVIAPGQPLTLAFRRAFPLEEEPLGAAVEIAVAGGEQRRIELPLPPTVAIPLPGEARGDLEVSIRLLSAERTIRSIEERVTVIEPWDERLGALVTAIRKSPSSVERATARGLLARLQALDLDLPPELPLPAAADLAFAERLVTFALAGEQAAELAAPGERWIRLPIGFGGTPCRIRVPNEIEGGPRPLVVAVHGMGGSEHLFFEAHGLGLGPRLAEERGWIFAAPGFGMVGGEVEVGEVVTALEAFLPVDRKRVFLIGHSLGAMRITAAVVREPSRFRAIAPLSGGGVVPPGTDLAGLPCYLAFGDRDFGKGMSMSLATMLRRAGARITERTFAPSEHLLMVADSLPEVFGFFDESLRPEQ